MEDLEIEKIKCEHKNLEMGSYGGMLSPIYKDKSSRPPLIYSKCNECGFKKLSFEMPPEPSEALKNTLELANSFYSNNKQINHWQEEKSIQYLKIILGGIFGIIMIGLLIWIGLKL